MDAPGVPVLPAWGIYITGLQLAGCLGLSWLGSLLADVFDGRADPDTAMAGVSLALVSWSLARMVEPLPWLGWLAMVFVVWGGRQRKRYHVGCGLTESIPSPEANRESVACDTSTDR